MEGKKLETVEIDPHGDVRLLVKDDKGNSKILIASSKVMSLVCQPWRAMLGPDSKFREAQVKHMETIPFPDDDARAVEIMLYIAHLRFDKVPSKVDIDDLVEIAILADKYDAGHILQAWLGRWLNLVQPLMDTPGYEQQWLSISSIMGLPGAFVKVASRMILSSHVNEQKECITATGSVLEGDFVESILKARAVTIDKMLAELYSYTDSHPDRTSTMTSCTVESPIEGRRMCDTLIFGSFVSELIRLNFWPTKKTCSDILSGVEALRLQLEDIDLLFQRGHANCSFSNELNDRLKSISKPDQVFTLSDAEKRHLEFQRSKFPAYDDTIPEELLKIDVGEKEKLDK
ncbi:hypothetical protein B7463_g2946, partial [Scytalidium lignicola]